MGTIIQMISGFLAVVVLCVIIWRRRHKAVSRNTN